MSLEAILALLVGLLVWGLLIVFAVRRYWPPLRRLFRRCRPIKRIPDQLYSEIDTMIVAGYDSEQEVLSYAEEVAPQYGAVLAEVRIRKPFLICAFLQIIMFTARRILSPAV